MSEQSIKPKIILFNGPAGVGKDFAANSLQAYLSKHFTIASEKIKMIEPCKKAVHNLYGVWYQWNHYDDPKLAPLKDQVHPLMLGLTPRQAYIAMSDHMIALHGPDVLGRMACNKIHNMTARRVFIFDAGLPNELDVIIKYVGVENFMCVELSSDGKTFEGDSRSYVGDYLKEKYPKITVRRIDNEFGGVEERMIFIAMVNGVVSRFLGLEK